MDMDVKGYGFLYFAENMSKKLSNKWIKIFLIVPKKSTTDAMKTASKRAIQTTAVETGDLIGNKISDKLDEADITKERYISPEKRQQIIDALRLL